MTKLSFLFVFFIVRTPNLLFSMESDLQVLTQAYEMATEFRKHPSSFNDARLILKHIVEQIPKKNQKKIMMVQSMANRSLAKIYDKNPKKRYKAKAAIQKAISLAPQDPINYLWLGNCPHIDYKTRQTNLKTALKLSQAYSQLLVQVQSLLGLGKLESVHKNSALAYEYFKQGLNLISKIPLETLQEKNEILELKLRVHCYLGLGNESKNSTEKIYHFKNALKAIDISGLELVKISQLKIRALYLLAQITDDSVIAQEGLELVKQVIFLTTKGEIQNIEYLCKFNILLGNILKKETYFLETLRLLKSQKINKTDLTVQVYLGLGNCRNIKNAKNSDSHWYELSIDTILHENPNKIDSKLKFLLAKAYLGLGNCNYKDRNFSQALTYYNKSLEYYPNQAKLDKYIPLCQKKLQISKN